MQRTKETLASEIIKQEKNKVVFWRVATITGLVVIAIESAFIILF